MGVGECDRPIVPLRGLGLQSEGGISGDRSGGDRTVTLGALNISRVADIAFMCGKCYREENDRVCTGRMLTNPFWSCKGFARSYF
ncbi:hypothetical protein [Microcoleus sp. Pol12A6]|uniref:hypothetical protein n=1 Tax=Microcoleus sp. Pol12A6 TaxID=3055393 RepID=UPI002FD67E0E